MQHICRILPVAMAMAAAATIQPAGATVTFLGEADIAGSATDNSGLGGNSAPGFAQNLIGGLGSSVAYAGGNSYIMVPDRGPADGASSYVDRFYEFRMDITASGVTIVDQPSNFTTRLMTNTVGQQYVGTSSAIASGLRFDPEGVRVANGGKSIFVSDEYGPYIKQFDRQTGQQVKEIAIPAKFAIANPSAGSEILTNTSGRQTNRGMEGLAITPDGTKLYGMMQNALIQDNALSGTTRVGLYNRILQVDVATGATKEFAYKLNGAGNGVNEMVAINDHQFLVLERDGAAGNSAAVKQVYMIDIDGATDVSGLDSMTDSPTSLKAGVVAVQKSSSAFIDLLAAQFGLVGATFPEKIEGLAFGADLADGRHTLLVTTDNDFTAAPTRIWAFAISDQDFASLTNINALFDAQDVPEPAALAMFSLGLAGLTMLRRRRG